MMRDESPQHRASVRAGNGAEFADSIHCESACGLKPGSPYRLRQLVRPRRGTYPS